MHARRALDQAGAGRTRRGRGQRQARTRSSARSTAFSTSQRDDPSFRGIVRGAGRDAKKSVERARHHRLRRPFPEMRRRRRSMCRSRSCCRARLAQFSRSGLFKDVADHLTRVSSRKISKRRLSGRRLPRLRPRRWMQAPLHGRRSGARQSVRAQDVGPLGVSGCTPSNAQESGTRGKQPCWKRPKPSSILGEIISTALPATENIHVRQQAL